MIDSTAAGALICVVDDDEGVRDSCRILLETLGFAVRTYASGADILADDGHRQAQCFVVDQQMPGIDGLTTLGVLSRERPHVLTILITGCLDRGIIARASALKIDAVIEKPFVAMRLIELIGETRDAGRG
jgi:two-component system, LuxR family, response regulator FixJ